MHRRKISHVYECAFCKRHIHKHSSNFFTFYWNTPKNCFSKNHNFSKVYFLSSCLKNHHNNESLWIKMTWKNYKSIWIPAKVWKAFVFSYLWSQTCWGILKIFQALLLFWTPDFYVVFDTPLVDNCPEQSATAICISSSFGINQGHKNGPW